MKPDSKEILAGALVFLALCVPVSSHAATARAFGALMVRVEPEAEMSITPEIVLDPSGAQGGETQLHIALTVRINSGTTASLWLSPADAAVSPGTESSSSGDASSSGSATPSANSGGEGRRLLLTIDKNGRYSLTVPISSAAAFGPGSNAGLELTSSDEAIHLVYNVPKP